MSKNFEILRQAQKEIELLDRRSAGAASNSKIFEVLRQANRTEELIGTPSAPLPSAAGAEPGAPKFSRHSREETFKLVQRLFLGKQQPTAPRMVVFCGVGPESGCGWICARSGEHLSAQVRGAVCLVDANLYRPSLHEYFEVAGTVGLCDAICEVAPVQTFAQHIGAGNLWLVPAGSTRPGVNPHTILTSDRMHAVLACLRAQFEYVLIEAAPMDGAGDSSFIAAVTDGVILMMEPSYTPLQSAQKAKEDLRSAGARVLGVVFNERPLAIPRSLRKLSSKLQKPANRS
jgi:succinoglycan biosynthesis transport protein ExoP